MNTLIVNSLEINTELPFIQFIESDERKIDSTEDKLIIYFIKGDKASSTPFKVIGEDKELLPSSLLRTTINKTNNVNNVLIKKLTINDYLINQTILSDIPKSYIIYDEYRCDVFIHKNITEKDYLELLSINPYLLVSKLDDVVIANITNCILGRKVLNYTYPNTRAFTYKDTYTKYIVDEPLVIYQVKLAILNQLYEHGFESLKLDDEDELVEVPDILNYTIDNSNYEPAPIRVRPILNRVVGGSVVNIEWKLKTTSISKAFDIKNKYINRRLISNLTSIDITDYLGNPFKVAIQWDTMSGQLGDKSAVVDEENNYSHQLTFMSRIYFTILEDWTSSHLNETIINKIDTVVQLTSDITEKSILGLTYNEFNNNKLTKLI